MSKEGLKKVPSVQPKTGRWKVSDDGAYAYCSECEDVLNARTVIIKCLLIQAGNIAQIVVQRWKVRWSK